MVVCWFNAEMSQQLLTGLAVWYRCPSDIRVLLRMNCNYFGDLLNKHWPRQWMVCVVCQRSSNLRFNVIIVPSLRLLVPRKSARAEDCPNKNVITFPAGWPYSGQNFAPWTSWVDHWQTITEPEHFCISSVSMNQVVVGIVLFFFILCQQTQSTNHSSTLIVISIVTATCDNVVFTVHFLSVKPTLDQNNTS